MVDFNGKIRVDPTSGGFSEKTVLPSNNANAAVPWAAASAVGGRGESAPPREPSRASPTFGSNAAHSDALQTTTREGPSTPTGGGDLMIGRKKVLKRKSEF